MRTAGIVALGLLLLAALLGALGVVELPFGLLRGGDGEGDDAGLNAAGEAARRAGAQLDGADGTGRAARRTLGSESEVFGSVARGARIVGRVVEAGVTPLPVGGVRVTLARPNAVTAYLRTPSAGRWDVLEAVTDATGRFAFADVRPAAGYVVRALASGRPSASSPRLELAARQVVDLGDLVLVEGGAFEGRVLDGAGRALTGARVAITWRVESIGGMALADPDLLPQIEAQALTDERGLFVLEGLEAGPKTLVVHTTDHGGKVLARVEVVAGQRAKLGDILLAGRGSVGGRVEWEDGRPVAGARVLCGEARLDRPTLASALSGPDGAFLLEHLEGEQVRLGAFVPGIPVTPTGDVPMGSQDVRLVLPLTGGLVGRVVRGADGTPVTRFGLRLLPRDGEDGMARAVRTLVEGALGPQEFASPDGRFQIPFQAHGRYVLAVSAEGYPELTTEVFEVPASGRVDLGNIALADGRALGGIVRTRLGLPLAGAGIHLLSGATDLRIDGADVLSSDVSLDDSPDAVSDADGRFLVPAQSPGVYDLLVHHPHAVLQVVDDVDVRAASRADLDVVLEPAGEVQVRVLDARGRPGVAVDVVLVRLDGYALDGETDEGGQVRWTSVPAGPCLVRAVTLGEGRALRTAAYTDEAAARAEVYEALRRDGVEQVVRPGEVCDVLLRLPARTDVTVRVTPWAPDLKPLTGLSVRHAPSFGSRWLHTGEAGVFRLPLEPGTYELRVVPESGWDDMRVFEVTIPEAPTFTVELGG